MYGAKLGMINNGIDVDHNATPFLYEVGTRMQSLIMKATIAEDSRVHVQCALCVCVCMYMCGCDGYESERERVCFSVMMVCVCMCV